MKTEQLQTSALVAVAMLIGGGFTFYVTSRNQSTPSSAVSQPAAAREEATRTKPDPSAVTQFSIQHDTELDAAMAIAKSQRADGTLKPLATTPDEFARALGAINYRLYDFSVRFEDAPDEAAPGYAAYLAELRKLTDDLANLLSDEALVDSLEDTDPKMLAHHQSLLASGALDLDAATTGKMEALINAAFEKALPAGIGDRAMTEAEESDFGKKFEAMTDELDQQIRPLLTPEQIARLEALGPDQVLFGLSGE